MPPQRVWELAERKTLVTQAGSLHAEVSVRSGDACYVVAQKAAEASVAGPLVSGMSDSVGDAMRKAEALLDEHAPLRSE